jgi:hypothetical protein
VTGRRHTCGLAACLRCFPVWDESG